MDETFVQTQVRLVLERQCADLFMSMVVRCKASGWPITLFAFDFGDGGNLAYKTALSRESMHRTIEALLARWSGTPPDLAPPGVTPEVMRELAEQCKAGLPAGVGFALLLGAGPHIAYVGNGDREDTAALLAEFLEKERA